MVDSFTSQPKLFYMLGNAQIKSKQKQRKHKQALTLTLRALF